jgi:hypothetical protein
VNEIYREGYKVLEDEEEYVISYWKTLGKREDTGSRKKH